MGQVIMAKEENAQSSSFPLYRNKSFCPSRTYSTILTIFDSSSASALKFGKSKGFCDVKVYPSTTKFKLLTTLGKKAFENIVEKGEKAGNQHFLLFP